MGNSDPASFRWPQNHDAANAAEALGRALAACSGVFDNQGNFCPEFSDEKECIRVDQVILAVGQAADLSFLKGNNLIRVQGSLLKYSNP